MIGKSLANHSRGFDYIWAINGKDHFSYCSSKEGDRYVNQIHQKWLYDPIAVPHIWMPHIEGCAQSFVLKHMILMNKMVSCTKDTYLLLLMRDFRKISSSLQLGYPSLGLYWNEVFWIGRKEQNRIDPYKYRSFYGILAALMAAQN